MTYETSSEIEIAVAHYFGIRKHLIVPNVSWSMLSYECDMMVLLPSGFAAEVEIKISRSDLRADTKKTHQHRSNLMRYLYFAIPEKLEMCVGEIPERAGILIVRKTIKGSMVYGNNVEMLRAPKPNDCARKLSDQEKFNLARLGTLRMWNLKIASVERQATSTNAIEPA